LDIIEERQNKKMKNFTEIYGIKNIEKVWLKYQDYIYYLITTNFTTFKSFWDDLYQESYFAFLYALETYDDKKYGFPPWLKKYVILYCYRWIKRKGFVVKLPHKEEKLKKFTSLTDSNCFQKISFTQHSTEDSVFCNIVKSFLKNNKTFDEKQKEIFFKFYFEFDNINMLSKIFCMSKKEINLCLETIIIELRKEFVEPRIKIIELEFEDEIIYKEM
jgi:hypothetical protein